MPSLAVKNRPRQLRSVSAQWLCSPTPPDAKNGSCWGGSSVPVLPALRCLFGFCSWRKVLKLSTIWASSSTQSVVRQLWRFSKTSSINSVGRLLWLDSFPSSRAASTSAYGRTQASGSRFGFAKSLCILHFGKMQSGSMSEVIHRSFPPSLPTPWSALMMRSEGLWPTHLPIC